MMVLDRCNFRFSLELSRYKVRHQILEHQSVNFTFTLNGHTQRMA